MESIETPHLNRFGDSDWLIEAALLWIEMQECEGHSGSWQWTGYVISCKIHTQYETETEGLEITPPPHSYSCFLLSIALDLHG